ncbi:hypothetical protein [Mucilaginibacter psychrotolerans]|uniref:Uncharacterized protein n=1 Tax=Mucilaginibacter psychrotolerans TaxID=1524096 RepID=A0A4Y8SNT2_9SPHI|nr:hypothetical protein [Mucilaginibacter psychrotolerans]TFF40315.1 hypothetical protein E2R66_03435 [Mucilaginibacter psychrotolerans]
MMKTILTIVFSIMTVCCLGQGFNNNEKYDQQDLEFLFAKSGIEVFKFPFKSKTNSALNIIIEEYVNGNLVGSNDFFEDFQPMFKLLDEPISFFFPPMNDSVSQHLRFYLTRTPGGIKISAKTSKIERQYTFRSKHIKLTQTRAFDYIPKFIDKKQPLFVFYGTKKKDLLSCPGDANVEKVIKMYDYLVVVYADLLKH